jgi:hypothetical protein
MDKLKTFLDQVIALSWLRCAMEEGVVFVNKYTGRPETNEMVIFQNMEHQTGAFDVPQAEVTPKGMERCLYETIGRFSINSRQTDIQLILESPDFKTLVQRKVRMIHDKSAQMLRGSPISA